MNLKEIADKFYTSVKVATFDSNMGVNDRYQAYVTALIQYEQAVEREDETTTGLNRCKHGVHGTDCFECYLSKNAS